MKKIILSFILLFGLFTISNAQLGIRAGLNMANVSYSGEDEIETSNLIGFHFGVVNTFNVAEKIDFRPGLLYSGKGYSIDFDFGGVSESLDFKLTYLEVPLDFVYNASGVDGLKINAGPYLGLLLAAKADGEDVKDDVESLDFGLNLGLGYRFGNISIGAQYGLGLANLQKESNGDETVKNTNISIYGIYHL
jgi:hypothetical protein